MKPVHVLVCGLPGNMARNVASHVLADSRFSLVPLSLTGPGILAREDTVAGKTLALVPPEKHAEALAKARQEYPRLVAVDYTHPSAAAGNTRLYAAAGIPFVMGTTGGDRKQMTETVAASSVPAVISPNMSREIVGLTAMLTYAANSFPGLFKGYSLSVRESHQHGKADTSGTAKALVELFGQMGAKNAPEGIVMERNPQRQREVWGVPEEYLSGHAWHTYTLVSPDNTVKFEFTHNVCGRDIYVHGTLDAVAWLYNKSLQGCPGQVFSMIDVLAGN
jgi:4-hydroxy-tetrahydrodipicolinate reductase